MRIYHFLSTQNGLDSIRYQRIKLSQIDKLNDPFELWCSAQGDKRLRRALRAWKHKMAKRYGLLCFCKHWRNPVLWSHYADKHRGVCLGFDVAEGWLMAIQYVDSRIPLQLPASEEVIRQLLFTKYTDWQYEEELRGWCSLEERDSSSGHYFYTFDDKVRLREVIVGPLCDTPKVEFESALKSYKDDVRVTKARLAFTKFQIVENLQGFR